MAVRNQEATLAAAINSILKQSFRQFEFIIVNDASTDHSVEILADFAVKDKRIKLLTNRRQLGLTRSLNQAIKKAKGKYLARMDGDDIALPRRLEKQLKFLADHPQIALLGTAAYLINQKNKQIGLKRFPSDHQHIRASVLRYCPFIHPTWMFRRSALKEIGDYNEKFPFAQDYELVLRFLTRFRTANLAEPLLKYRVNSASAISLKNLKKQELFALKARFLALTSYGYPVTESWKLIKPALSFFVPAFIKKPLYRRFFWNSSK